MLDKSIRNTKSFKFDVSTALIKGTRAYQEDAVISHFPLGQKTGFAVLSDGMGGSVAGSVASEIVVTECFRKLKEQQDALEDAILDIPTLLRKLAHDTNTEIRTRAEIDDETYGMGATLLACVIRGNQLYWISIGDSPLFLFRKGKLHQLNQNHSMAAQIDLMVKVGGMKPEVAENHPDRHTLTSALNGDEIPLIDCPSAPFLLEEEDVLVVASDGIQSLSDTVIANTMHIAQSGRSIDVANAFLSAIEMRDKEDQDNTGFAVIQFGITTKPETANKVADMLMLAVAEDNNEPIGYLNSAARSA